MANYQVGNLELNIITYANNATKSLGKMNNELDKTKKTLKNTGIFATLGKWNYYINSARYYGRQLAQLVQYGMDYTETQNLWQTANRNNIADATKFVDKMAEAYGLSEATLMNYQAIFKNMLSSLGGISDELSSTLSEQVTQLALDFASLYNVSIDSAMTKFEAVLSGQVRPIRSVSGYDITENTIFDIYQKAGGEKTMRQLSQIEKRLLRIYAVFGQMGESGATGDMAKTLNTAANQTRVMSEQLKEVLTWSGQVILLWLNNAGVFKYVNAALMTMKEVMKSLAYSAGYEQYNFMENLFDSTQKENEEIDKLLGKFSFDEFESLTSSQNNGAIDENIYKLLESIETTMNVEEMEASKLSKLWLEQLGLGEEFYRITYKTGEVIEKTAEEYANMTEAELEGVVAIENYRKITESTYNILKDKLNGVLTILKAIASYFVASKLIGIANSLKGIIDIVSLAGKNFGLTAIIGTLIYLYATNEQVRDSLNRLFASLSPVLDAISQLANALAPIIEFLANIVAEIIITIDKLGLIKPLFFGIIGSLIYMKSMDIAKWIIDITSRLSKFKGTVNGLEFAFSALAMVMTYEIGKAFLNLFPEGKARKTASGIMMIVGAVIALVAALVAMNTTLSWGTMLPVLLAGVGLAVAGVEGHFSNIEYKANGGFVDKGQLFVAREAGAEMVGSMGGHTAVANNDQIVEGIKQGVYEATITANAQSYNGGVSGDVILDGNKVGRLVAKATYNENVRVGRIKATRR